MRSKDQELMKRIKAFAEEYAMANGGATPSTAEIAREFTMSRSGAYGYLKAMDRLGMIQYEKGEIRTALLDKIDLNPRLAKTYAEATAAGAPNEVDGVVESIVSIPPFFVDGRKGEFSVQKVSGESMVDAGIDSGDVIICAAGKSARVDDIVLAYIRGSGSTVKRLCRDDEGYFLWAENSGWDPEERMFGREFEIQGVAIKVLKNL